MTKYYLPAGYGTAEHVEKKSRFIGQVWPVRTEAEAREKIEAVKKQYHDARHNCWCFALRDGTLRYSDDGEPQGTAGQPMLEVLTRQGVTDAVIVVTQRVTRVPESICGKPVYLISLNRLWGVALP